MNKALVVILAAVMLDAVGAIWLVAIGIYLMALPLMAGLGRAKTTSPGAAEA